MFNTLIKIDTEGLGVWNILSYIINTIKQNYSLDFIFSTKTV